MNIFYMSTAMSDYSYEQLRMSCRKFIPTYAGIAFDRNVAKGLSEKANITIVSYRPLPSYPRSNIAYWRKTIEVNILTYHYPSILNYPLNFGSSAIKKA